MRCRRTVERPSSPIVTGWLATTDVQVPFGLGSLAVIRMLYVELSTELSKPAEKSTYFVVPMVDTVID